MAVALRQNRFRPFLLATVGILIVTKVLILSPSTLEENKTSNPAVDPDTLIQDTEPTRIPGLPKDRIAEYAIQQFQYVSVQNGEKQWRIESEQAFMYNPEKLVHSRKVKAFLFDPDGKITEITGLESKYYMNKRDLELYGDVKTVFPDGFELYSDYLRYKPNERRIIIPTTYHVHGAGQEEGGQHFRFKSHGLDYAMGDSMVILPKDVTVTLDRGSVESDDAPGVPDITTIESDYCKINRKINLAKFKMDPNKPLKTRFVHITQPTLFARSRRADLHYGNFNKVLQYLTAYEDVLVKETGKKKTTLNYATGSRADFDTHNNLIVLTGYPQAYQNSDTVTGDVILMHRDTDVIEIEHSNAFTTGEKNEDEE